VRPPGNTRKTQLGSGTSLSSGALGDSKLMPSVEEKEKSTHFKKSSLPGRYENTSIRGSGASLLVRPSSQQDDGYKRRKRKNLPSSKK